MRIISGKYKGKKILFPSKSITRPLRDRVKENIFNILQHSNKIQFEFKNSIVLDLCLVPGLLDWNVYQEM